MTKVDLLKAAALKYFGVTEKDIIDPVGKHTHMAGYRPTFEYEKGENISMSISWGDTIDWKSGGTYERAMASVYPERDGTFTAVMRHSKSKNNYDNTELWERIPIDYEKFDSFEAAVERLAYELGIREWLK